MKHLRQAAILELVDREPIVSQQVLQQRLRARGFRSTQATISRDMKELGLVKRASDGAYQRAPEEPPSAASAEAALEHVLAEFLLGLDRVQQLVVLKTGPGQAQPVAVAIDRAALRGVVGTIAGDDTILVVARDARRAAMLIRRLEGPSRR